MLLRIVLAAAVIVTSTAASAHITFAEPQAQLGSYYAGFLRVSHGCEASPTVSIRVEIPVGIDVARPQPKPGWALAIEHEALAQPIRSEMGSLVKQRVSAITWTGSLPADEFDQFGIMLKLPSSAGPLYFPTMQRCASGTNAWINRPATPDAWHATEMPAPMLIVTGGASTSNAAPMVMDHMGGHQQ